MKLKFKKQRYQEDAALSVVNVFKSQPKQDSLAYLLDKGCKAMRWGMEQLPEDQGALDEGYANALVKLSSVELLDNIHEVQRSNNIQESEKLSKGIGALPA
jgi:type III restriction enzyme